MTIFRGLGDSRSPLIFVAVACVVNVVGDLVLVAGFHLDAAGAAIATVLAQAVSVVLALLMLKRRQLPFKITKKDFRFNSQCKRFLTVGIPLALQEFLTQMSFLALCAFINKLGLEASSGYGVAVRIVSGANPLRYSNPFCTTASSVVNIDVSTSPKNHTLMKTTILTAILFSMIGYFNGHEKTLWVMIQGLIQTLLVRLPLAYFMSIQPDASLTNIGLAAPVATCFGIILNIIFFLHMTRKMKKV